MWEEKKDPKDLFKQKFNIFKTKVVEFKDKAIENTAEKISKSSLVLKSQQELDEFILTSKNKTFKNDKQEEKTTIKKSLLLVWNKETDFFKENLLNMPVILTKAFSQNIKIKMIDTSNKDINLLPYDLKETPAMIVFENTKVFKIIYSQENIKKVVKDLTLDINKTIQDL